jgi:excisionase family DNA binding protein
LHFKIDGQELPGSDNVGPQFLLRIVALHRRYYEVCREWIKLAGRSTKVVTMSTDQQQFLVTTKQAAAILAISERTLWQLTNDGHLPAVRFGRTVRYDLDDLRAFIAARRCGGNVDGN